MNSKRVHQKTVGSSSQNELENLLTMKDLLIDREDLLNLYNSTINEFSVNISLLAIKAIINSEIELLCGKP